MSPTRILILSDRRPGHFNLSEGIAAAIARKLPVETTRIEVSRGKWAGLTLAVLTRSRLPATAMLKLVYGISVDEIPPCDVIVSAGAETLAANVWLARVRSIPNLFYGSLRAFAPSDFALVLTSYAEKAKRPRHLFALKPSRTDPEKLPPTSTRPYAAEWPRTIALLIGGDTHGINYTEHDWNNLLRLVRDTTESHGTYWLVANSRRTPQYVSDMMAAMATETPSPIAAFLDVRATGAGTLTNLIARADAIVCTADSSSMLSESIWFRRPTIAVSPLLFTLDDHERGYRELLAGQGVYRQRDLELLTAKELIDDLAAVTPLPHNPQVELAERLARALPGLFPEA